MKNKKPPKTVIWKYRTVIIFIFVIIILIFVCFVGAWYLSCIGNDFGYSALLNMFGGLFTGLIFLSYQYFSNKFLREANMIVEKLKLLNEIPTFFANELDFCTDCNRPSEEQMEEQGIEIDIILEDNEGVSYALDKYKREVIKAEKQLNVIKDFLNNVLRMTLDYSSYEKKSTQTKQFFSTYSEAIQYVIQPYLLRKHSKPENSQLEDVVEIIETFETEEALNTYFENNPDILNNGQYWIDPPSNTYEVRVVYKNNVEVLIEDVYIDWIQKMNDLADATKDFNKVFLKNKEKIFEICRNNSNIIH